VNLESWTFIGGFDSKVYRKGDWYILVKDGLVRLGWKKGV